MSLEHNRNTIRAPKSNSVSSFRSLKLDNKTHQFHRTFSFKMKQRTWIYQNSDESNKKQAMKNLNKKPTSSFFPTTQLTHMREFINLNFL